MPDRLMPATFPNSRQKPKERERETENACVYCAERRFKKFEEHTHTHSLTLKPSRNKKIITRNARKVENILDIINGCY